MFIGKIKMFKISPKLLFKRILALSVDFMILLLIRISIILLSIKLIIHEQVLMFRQRAETVFGMSIEKMAETNYARDDFIEYAMHSTMIKCIICLILILMLVGILYHGLSLYFWNGQTVGKNLAKISTVSIKDEKLNIFQAFGRYTLMLIPFIMINYVFFKMSIIGIKITESGGLAMLAIMVFLWFELILLNKDGRTIHDFICKTKIIDNNKK